MVTDGAKPDPDTEPEQRRMGNRLALQVEESLAIGDHRDLDRLQLRGALGLLMMVGGIFRAHSSYRVEPEPEPACIFVVANPVAHGARLVKSIESALPERSELCTDPRLADETIKVGRPFPSLAARSIGAIVDRPRLRSAFQMRRSLGRRPLPTTPRLYAEYLFLAQSTRFLAAQEDVKVLSAHVTVLTDFDRSAFAAPWVRAARAAGLKTATLVHGEPNEPNYLPVAAANVLVWGDVQAAWFARNTHAAIHLIGRPDLVDEDVSSADVPRMIIVHSRETLSPTEVRALLSEVAECRRRNMPVELRLHPSSRTAAPGASWDTVASACDSIVVGRSALTDSVGAGDIVVGITSSALVDALGCGVDSRIVADRDRPLPPDLLAMAREEAMASVDAESPKRRRERYVVARGESARSLLRIALTELM